MGSQDIAYPPQIDYSYLGDYMNEIALNILVNSAAAASTLQAWDNMFVDIFTDADGTDNTINTGSSTATFDTDKYTNVVGSQADSHGEVEGATGAATFDRGLRITTHAGVTYSAGFTVTKHSSCTATHCTLWSDPTGTPANEEDVAFSGDVATFSSTLAASTTYGISCDKEGASYAPRKAGIGSWPIVGTNVDFSSGWDSVAKDVGEAFSWVTITTETDEITSGMIETNAITIPTGVQSHQVYAHNALAGTGSITYDISFDNGSTWITGQSLGQSNTDNHAGTQMILKLNLTGTGAGNTASAEDYAVLLTY